VKATRKRIREITEGFLDKAITKPERWKHRGSVRASSLPICWRDVVLTKWSKATNQPREDWFLHNILYVEMGTAAHEVVQTYLGKRGMLYGSWECPDCGKTVINCHYPTDDNRPCMCGADYLYLEYTAVHPNKKIGVRGEFGHIDGIMPLGPGEGYIVVEFKTTAVSLVSKLKANGPYSYHIDQASAYYEFCEAGYVKVVKRSKSTAKNPRGRVLWTKRARLPEGGPQGILFIYIKRDNPRISQWVMFDRQPRRGVLKDIENNAPKVDEGSERGILPEGRCEKREDARDEWGTLCPWSHVCFGKDEKTLYRDAKELYVAYVKDRDSKKKKMRTTRRRKASKQET